MVSESEMRRREQLAAEMILQSEGLTDELEDEEAEVLLEWGLEKAEAYARATKGLAEEEARSVLEAGVSWVQRVMRTINRLVGERYEMTDEEVLEELLLLISLLEEKPTPSEEEGR